MDISCSGIIGPAEPFSPETQNLRREIKETAESQVAGAERPRHLTDNFVFLFHSHTHSWKQRNVIFFKRNSFKFEIYSQGNLNSWETSPHRWDSVKLSSSLLTESFQQCSPMGHFMERQWRVFQQSSVATHSAVIVSCLPGGMASRSWWGRAPKYFCWFFQVISSIFRIFRLEIAKFYANQQRPRSLTASEFWYF